jgi:broad specificity phosphatase PhoE
VARATTILIARHGESDWNVAGRWQGHADRPLSERGREQAEALAERLEGKGVEAIYASDLTRALETANVIAAARGLDVRTDSRLREIHFGGWEGLTTAEIEQRYPDEVARWRSDDGSHAFAGGETYAQMGERVVRALSEIASAHPTDTVLVVLHGGPIRGVLAHAVGITYGEQRRLRSHLANCDLIRVRVEDGVFTPLD